MVQFSIGVFFGKVLIWVFFQIKDDYYGISREAVSLFCQSCRICKEHASQVTKAPVQAIKTSGIHKRGLVS